MGCPVVCPQEKESAALGAAIQAAWCHQQADSPQAADSLDLLCQRFVQLDERSRALPDEARQRRYADLYQRYLHLLQKEYGVTL